MEPPTPEPAATIPEPESTAPTLEPPATIPKPESTFTIKPIKISQFIAEIWFLRRAFARFSPITHSITSCCCKQGGKQGGVTSVGLQLLNHDSCQILAAVHIAPKDLECERPVTFESIKIFTIFRELRRPTGRSTPVTISLHSTQAETMDGWVSYHEPQLNIYSRVSYVKEPYMESYYRCREPRMIVELKKFDSTFNFLTFYESEAPKDNPPQSAQNLHMTTDGSLLKINIATTRSNPVPVEYCSKELSGKKMDMEFSKFDI